MALHSKKEFAELCGIRTKDLSVYILRKKVNVLGDQIDDGDPLNQLFVADRQSKKKPKPKVKEKKAAKPRVKKETAAEKRERTAFLDAELNRKTFQAEKIQNEIELQRMEISKKRKELVPTELVAQVIRLTVESIKSQYMNAVENLIVVMSQVKGFTAVEVAEIRSKQTKLMNVAIESSVETAKRGLITIANEYAEKRGVGQHGKTRNGS